MKRAILFISLLFCYSIMAQTTVTEYADFLKQEHQSPKEYILELFETNDIIILGERDHRDTTQYDLILDIIADERFIKNVGHVYTEVGVINRTAWVNEVLKNEYPSDTDFEYALIELYRELDFNTLWDKYNMYKYLKGIYNINKELKGDDKITVGLTDCEFDWEGMTSQKLEDFYKELKNNSRDSKMAANFIKLYEKQDAIKGNKKALLIQSRPHAIKMDISYKARTVKKTGSYIVDKYGEQVKIVAFNWYHWMPVEWYKWMPEKNIELTDDGKWDAAFYLTNNTPVAFNIENTPFGQCEFDYSYEQDIKYEDLIDGIIFYKPFYEFDCTIGIPEVVDDDFADEMERRGKIIEGDDYSDTKESLKGYYNEVRTFNCEDYTKLKAQMEKWLIDNK